PTKEATASIADRPGAFHIGRITGCTNTPINSNKPYPTNNAENTAPTGTINPTDITSLSNKYGAISGSAIQAGAKTNTNINVTTAPITLKIDKMISTIFLFHVFLKNG